MQQYVSSYNCTAGQAPAAWAIGAKCQAVYSADGQWYTASVTGVSASGNFVVSFESGGGVDEVWKSFLLLIRALNMIKPCVHHNRLICAVPCCCSRQQGKRRSIHLTHRLKCNCIPHSECEDVNRSFAPEAVTSWVSRLARVLHACADVQSGIHISGEGAHAACTGGGEGLPEFSSGSDDVNVVSVTKRYLTAQVGKEGVRPAPEEAEAYRGVAAPKRKVVQDDPSAPIEMPKAWTRTPFLVIVGFSQLSLLAMTSVPHREAQGADPPVCSHRICTCVTPLLSASNNSHFIYGPDLPLW